MNSNLKIVSTSDGSHTVLNEELGVYYHSINGALQESRHIFIGLGLTSPPNPLSCQERGRLANSPSPDRRGVGERWPPLRSIFEMGFGTGLNALLTWQEADKHKIRIDYTTVETNVLSEESYRLLNYDNLLNTNNLEILHKAEWEKRVELSAYFSIEKRNVSLQDFETNTLFDVIYYDAFAPRSQPELWTEAIFQKMASVLKSGGILVTYCSKVHVQKNLKAAGFRIEKHPGPKYKREVLRAIKN